MTGKRSVGPARKAITRGVLALILLCFVWGFLIEPSRLVVHEMKGSVSWNLRSPST